MQEDRATAPQEPLVAKESQNLTKLLHGDEAEKTPVQAAAAFRWNQKLEELKAYEAKHGSVKRILGNKSLYSWVHKQHSDYYRLLKQGYLSSMTEYRIKKLEEINRWMWSSHVRFTWDERLVELKKYKHEHGDCLVPLNYEANPQLGGWCV